MRWARRASSSIRRYEVTVRRRGPSPLVAVLLVGADSRERAADLAVAVVEIERGGMFEAARVRRVPRVPGVTVGETVY